MFTASTSFIPLILITSFFVVLGHDGRRVAQLAVLFLPALLWLVWPVQSAMWQRMRRGAIWALAMAFVADGLLRAYLWEAYQSAPDSTTVLGALANTNPREATEYLQTHWRAALLGCAVWAATGALLWRCLPHKAAPQLRREHRWQMATWITLLLLCLVALASKPWRRLHPLLYWPALAQSVMAQQDQWANQAQRRAALHANALNANPTLTRSGPSTVVLVITDSINRDNMQLYGYGRATTPRLVDLQRQQPEQMLVLRHAWSADASTLPALDNLFGMGEPHTPQPQHLVALARAAGYKVWWMSNHDDMAVEQQHARLADVVDMVNRTPGRASASLDGELLDCIEEALADKAERKFIIVHLLGAHPHYRLRFPQGQNPFDDGVDAVESQLQSQGRSTWVRRYRQDYDAALLYHDFVVAESLRITQRVLRKGEYRAWFYLSDHGQEVGHGENRVGHSPATASGYRIPALAWSNGWAAQPRTADNLPSVAQRPFRADWAGWTVAHLLSLQWAGQQHERDVLNPGYQWAPPALPVQVRSFTE